MPCNKAIIVQADTLRDSSGTTKAFSELGGGGLFRDEICPADLGDKPINDYLGRGHLRGGNLMAYNILDENRAEIAALYALGMAKAVEE